MADAQDGTSTCVGHMEGTIGRTSAGLSGYERILCAFDTGGTTRWAVSGMTEGPSDGATTEEDRGGEQPPRLRLSRHAEPRWRQVEPIGDLHSQRQACVSSAVLGSEAQHSGDIPADAHRHRAEPGA